VASARNTRSMKDRPRSCGRFPATTANAVKRLGKPDQIELNKNPIEAYVEGYTKYHGNDDLKIKSDGNKVTKYARCHQLK
jgi:hypothetical protein